MWLALVLAFFVSLVGFYPLSGRAFMEERLRLVGIHVDGLNAVLTGLLGGLGIVLGAGIGGGQRYFKWFEFMGAALLCIGLTLSATRGGILATVLALIVCGWGRWGVLRYTWMGLLTGVGAFAVCSLVLGDDVSSFVERGDAGRLQIYWEYLGRINGMEWLWGKGGASALEAEVLGWFVHHPHSAWVTQIVHTGFGGMILLVFTLAKAGVRGLVYGGDSGVRLLLGWLVFGGAALTLDGAQIFSLSSIPRIEPLLLLVPSILLLSLDFREKHALFGEGG